MCGNLRRSRCLIATCASRDIVGVRMCSIGALKTELQRRDYAVGGTVAGSTSYATEVPGRAWQPPGRGRNLTGGPDIMSIPKPHRRAYSAIPARAAERAATRYEVDENGCHVSTYSVASHGYAQVGWQDGDARGATTAHRAAWVHHTGQQIPDGLTVDHACRNRRCVNMDHLRLMTLLQNARDNGWAAGTRYVGDPVDTGRKCPAGHTVYQYPSGSYGCRECAAELKRRKDERKRAGDAA